MKLVIKMQRYFAVDKDLNISDKDKHHIINVMRMKLNDKIEIVYNEKVYMCEINDISKKDVSYSVKDIIDVNNELPLKVTIAVSLVNETYAKLKDTRSGLYFQSPVYVYGFLRKEILTGKM